jgi:hypothetical protein
MTEEEAREYIDKYVSILSVSGEGMMGKVWKIEDGWLIVDYGYGIRLEDIQEITIEDEDAARWDEQDKYPYDAEIITGVGPGGLND